MRNLILLVIACCGFGTPTALSQNKGNQTSILDSKIEEYNKKRILSDIKTDIDGDGISDYLAIYCEPTIIGQEEITTTKLVYLLSSNNYEDTICQNFLPSQKKIKSNTSEINEYIISPIIHSKKGIDVVISRLDKTLSDYKRTITFRYDKKEKTLETVKDGGIGVFSNTEKYVNVKKIAKENITLKNWDDWYSNFICSNQTTLNNKIVFVENEDEFIYAIDNNTTIILKTNKLDLSLDKISQIPIKKKNKNAIKYGPINKDMGVAYADSAWWIEGVSNLSIIGQKSTILSSNVSKEYILWLNNCKDIELSNVSIFHNPETYDGGNGWNMCVSNSSDITIRHTTFNGFGGVGLFLYKSQKVNTDQSTFAGIKNYAILVRNATDLIVNNCNFLENQSTVIQLDNAFGQFANCSFFNNTYYYLVFLSEPDLKKSYATFTNCKEYNNTKLYDFSAKLGYSYFGGIDGGGLSDFDSSKDLNSGSVDLGF